MKNHQPDMFQDKSSERIFFNRLQTCFDDYVEEYDILKGADLRCTSIKMQKTVPEPVIMFGMQSKEM